MAVEFILRIHAVVILVEGQVRYRIVAVAAFFDGRIRIYLGQFRLCIKGTHVQDDGELLFGYARYDRCITSVLPVIVPQMNARLPQFADQIGGVVCLDVGDNGRKYIDTQIARYETSERAQY